MIEQYKEAVKKQLQNLINNCEQDDDRDFLEGGMLVLNQDGIYKINKRKKNQITFESIVETINETCNINLISYDCFVRNNKIDEFLGE